MCYICLSVHNTSDGLFVPKERVTWIWMVSQHQVVLTLRKERSGIDIGEGQWLEQ